MLKETKLPNELIDGIAARKIAIEGIDEIQSLYLEPNTSIKKHGHNSQWEVWLRLSDKSAYICLKNEEHKLVNKTGKKILIMAIKGHKNYQYDELSQMFMSLGFICNHGDLIID